VDRRAAARAGLYGLLVLAPLAAGTIHRLPIALAVIVAGTICLLLLHSGWRLRFDPLTALLGVAAVVCAVQLVPLPRSLVYVLQPLRRDFEPITSSAPQPLTMDVPATLAALALLVAALCVALAVRQLASDDQRRRSILKVVVLSSATAALLACAQEGHLLRQLVWPPDVAPPDLDGTLRSGFVNLNHAAACFTVGSVGALSLGLLEDGAASLAWLALSAFLAACVGLTLSKGGAAACAIGLLVVVGLVLHRRAHDHGTQRRRVAVALAVLAVAALATGGAVYERMVTSASSLSAPEYKIHIWRACAPVALRNWALGIGRGAFALVSPTCNQTSGVTAIPYLENEPLQALVDFGLPVGIAVITLGAWVGIAVWRRAWKGDKLAIAVAGALVALALHNLVDFNLEAGGVLLPVVALCGVALQSGEPRRVHRARRSHSRSFWVAPLPIAVIATAAIGIGGLLLLPRERLIEEDDGLLTRLANDGVTTDSQVADAAVAAIGRHPYDSFAYATAGAALAPTDPARAMGYLDDALLIDPRSITAHVGAAIALAHAGRRQQGLLEVRFAAQAAYPPVSMGSFIGRYCQTTDEVLAASPDIAEVRDDAAGQFAGIYGPAQALALFKANAMDFPDDRDLALRYATVAAQTQNTDAALDAAHLLKSRFSDVEALTAAGQDESAAGDAEEALADLQRATSEAPSDGPAAFALARFFATHNRLVDARSELDRIGGQALSSADIVALHQARADIDRIAGDEADALKEESLAKEAGGP
jgi:hypothetical protein